MDKWTTWNDFDPRDRHLVKDQAPLQTVPVIWGWDIAQWAAAIERVGIGGTTQKYMKELQRTYRERYNCEPLAAQIVGASVTGNFPLAEELFGHEELIEYVPIHQMEDI